MSGRGNIPHQSTRLRTNYVLHNLKHNKMLHENNLILTVVTRDIPRVSEEDRVRIKQLSRRFRHVLLCFGFMETPNVPKAIGAARKLGLEFDIMSSHSSCHADR